MVNSWPSGYVNFLPSRKGVVAAWQASFSVCCPAVVMMLMCACLCAVVGVVGREM